MSRLDIIRTITGYNYALFDRLWDSIMHLTDEQFIQEIDYSHGSIRNQMVHAANTEASWLRGLKDDPQARQFTLDPADYPTRDQARDLWNESAHDFAGYVASLDEAGLERYPQNMPGPVWQVIVHVVNHGTDHRAQILRLLYEFGAPTFDQDLILHLWFR